MHFNMSEISKIPKCGNNDGKDLQLKPPQGKRYTKAQSTDTSSSQNLDRPQSTQQSNRVRISTHLFAIDAPAAPAGFAARFANPSPAGFGCGRQQRIRAEHEKRTKAGMRLPGGRTNNGCYTGAASELRRVPWGPPDLGSYFCDVFISRPHS